MSKESIRASINVKKAEIARIRTSIAQERSRKKEASERYSARIKMASSKPTKDSYRREKASVMAHYEANIRSYQTRIASLQRNIVSLREQLKYAK